QEAGNPFQLRLQHLGDAEIFVPFLGLGLDLEQNRKHRALPQSMFRIDIGAKLPPGSPIQLGRNRIVMPLQNRITPFGEIIATPARGMFTGNRGIIHDPARRTLLKKRWSLKCWLICQLKYKHFHREPMARHSWTELFFLDEATALAAGHRPCFYCSRERVEAFRAAWAKGNGGP